MSRASCMPYFKVFLLASLNPSSPSSAAAAAAVHFKRNLGELRKLHTFPFGRIWSMKNRASVKTQNRRFNCAQTWNQKKRSAHFQICRWFVCDCDFFYNGCFCMCVCHMNKRLLTYLLTSGNHVRSNASGTGTTNEKCWPMERLTLSTKECFPERCPAAQLRQN